MRKIIAIGGEPGTGKTTLVKRVIDHYGYESFKQFTYGLLRGYTRDHLIILGVYPVAPGTREGAIGPWGTDRLSTNVLDDAKRFVENLKAIRPETHRETVILWEGDRLFTQHFLKPCRDHADDLIILVMTATKETRLARGGSRGPYSKSSEWLRAKASKVWGAARAFGARTLINETWADHDENYSRLLKYLGPC
jgi:hypothetical protein